MSKKKGKKDTKKGGNDQYEKEIEALESKEDDDGILKHAVVFNL